MKKIDHIKSLIGSLNTYHTLPESDFKILLNALVAPALFPQGNSSILQESEKTEILDFLYELARKTTHAIYEKKIFMRGLIEFTNYCKNNCFYCGIQGKNKNVSRYRLTKDEILECCTLGFNKGIRTFVLQGGEDDFFTKEKICAIVKSIKENFKNCAVTLSIGEKSKEEYTAYKKAGVDRFLLRHETADETHYAKLHPHSMSLKNRFECLNTLKTLGFQTGTGFLVGSPYQTIDTIYQDLEFIQKLQPEMIGIGPFLPHTDTQFSNEPKGSVEATLCLISILRLLKPNALIPATTALGTASSNGREQGILAGANVVMPNLSPLQVRKKYLLYDNKISTGDEALEGIEKLQQKITSIGYSLTGERGDCKIN